MILKYKENEKLMLKKIETLEVKLSVKGPEESKEVEVNNDLPITCL